MIIHKAYKFRLYPTKEQQILIGKTIGCSRFVFNHFLSEWNQCYEDTGKGLSYGACSANLTALKKETDTLWLQEVDSIALQSSLRNLSDSFDRFFKKQNSAPRFKSKRNPIQSYTTKLTNGNIAVVGNKLKLPKLGLVPFAKSKEVDGRILNATIRRNPSGKYFISILVETEVQELPKTGSVCGIDVGLKDFADLSANLSGNLPRSKECFPDGGSKPKRMGANCPNRKTTRSNALGSPESTSKSTMPEPITCRKYRPRSSKITTSSASRICWFPTWSRIISWQKPSATPVGPSSGPCWNTKRAGTASRLLQWPGTFHPANCVPAADTKTKT